METRKIYSQIHGNYSNHQEKWLRIALESHSRSSLGYSFCEQTGICQSSRVWRWLWDTAQPPQNCPDTPQTPARGTLNEIPASPKEFPVIQATPTLLGFTSYLGAFLLFHQLGGKSGIEGDQRCSHSSCCCLSRLKTPKTIPETLDCFVTLLPLFCQMLWQSLKKLLKAWMAKNPKDW